MSSLLVVGAGGHGRVIADAAISSGLCQSVMFLDDNYPDLASVDGHIVAGRVNDYLDLMADHDSVAVGIGDNEVRLRVLQSIIAAGGDCPPVMHPSAIVCGHAEIGAGSVILAGAVIGVGVRLGIGCIANTGCTIDHDCDLQDAVHISPGANLAGGVHVGALTWIGIGATVNQTLNIGARVLVGASAAVIGDVSDDTEVAGVPARAIARS